MSKLSNRQNVRLGGLIAVMGGREPYSPILEDLMGNDFVAKVGDNWTLTEKGVNEKDRLSILAGLMVDRDYIAHRPRNQEKATTAFKSD